MTPSTNHKGEIRYACETSKGPYSPPHTRKSVAGEVVEDEVWRAIESALDNPQRVLQELLRQQEDAERQHTHIDRDKESYERQLARYEQESQRLLDVYLAGAVSIETFKTRNSELELRQARIREEIAALDATAQAIQHGALTLETVRNYFAQALERLTTMSAEDKSLTAESLDVRAIWTPGAPLEIAGAINLWVTSGTPQCSAHEPSYRHSCQARESSAYDH
jgi:hypothetical protein